MNAARYISESLSNQQCEGERFGAEGFAIHCEDTPVFELGSRAQAELASLPYSLHIAAVGSQPLRADFRINSHTAVATAGSAVGPAIHMF